MAAHSTTTVNVTKPPIVKRYVRPRGTESGVQEDGFLPDMDGAYGKVVCPNTVPFAQAFQTRCTVILGEPGIGKSTAMAQRRQVLGNGAVSFDLRWKPSSAVLACEQLMSWQRGERDLHLVIDSIDEATDTEFARLFVGTLRDGPIERLKLELACRGAEWPPVLEEELPRLFGNDEVKYFQLEPLQRKDVAAIAGGDANAFLVAVGRYSLGAIASVPMTLRLLLTIFDGGNGTLPSSSVEIYEKACLELCRERSATRRRAAGGLDAPARLNRASEIAVVSVLCRKSRLRKNLIATQSSELPVLELAGAITNLDEDAVLETLKSGLFSPMGPDTWGWLHQSLPEFLTARWIKRSSLSSKQLRQILLHSLDGCAVVPQLSGVAAWLACLDSDVVRLLATNAPELLLSVSSTLVTDEDKAVAASAHLERVRKLETTAWLERAQCQRLHSARLATLLKVHMLDDTASLPVLRRCLHIAGVLGLSELEDVMCQIALDINQDISVRVGAIDAVFALPGDRTLVARSVKPLATPERTDDPDQELRGAVLGHFWHKWVGADEFFTLLTPPRAGMNGSRYRNVWFTVERSLADADLPAALAWLERNLPMRRSAHSLIVETLSTTVCRKAMVMVESPAIRLALAKVAVRGLKHAWPLFKNTRKESELLRIEDAQYRERRRWLVNSMAQVSTDPEHDGFWTVCPYGDAPLVDSLDLDWLMSEWRASVDVTRAYYGSVIQVLGWSSKDGAVLDAILAEVGEDRLSPLLRIPRWIDLDSDEAAQLRASYDDEIRHYREMSELDLEQRENHDRSARERSELWQRAVNGEPIHWLRFVDYALAEAHGYSQGLLECVFRLDSEPGLLPSLVRCATAFLSCSEAARCADDSGSEASPFHESGTVAYLSLRVVQLASSDRGELKAFVQSWARAVVCWPSYWLNSETDRDCHRELMLLAFSVASSLAIAALKEALQEQLVREHPPPVLEFVPNDSCVGDLLVEFLDNQEYQPRTGGLLSRLLVVQRERALRWASEELSRPLVSDGTRSKEIVRVLLEEGRSDSWDVAWRECESDFGVAIATIPMITDQFERDAWGQKLSVGQNAELYGWLEQHAPIDASVPEFSEKRMFRQRLLNRLTASGTEEALNRLKSLLTQFPDNVAVRVALPGAADRYREESWKPLTITEFRLLLESAERRLVNSDEHLLAVVSEALDEYQLRLHAEPPAVVDLWNDVTGTYRPKTENQFSDHLARFLKDRLARVVVNREVEIRPREVEQPGQRIDLLIQATNTSVSTSPYTVVIEVKGAWNPGLATDIEEQLRDRYVDQGKYRCGIYLVGWFDCSKWDVMDKRRAVTRRLDRQIVTAALMDKAQALQTEGRTIRVCVLDATLGNPVATEDGEIVATGASITAKSPSVKCAVGKRSTKKAASDG
jgi:hypothetical protein